MARRPRIFFPGALYHVVSRGNQRQRIFLDERDFRTFFSYLVEYKAKSILSADLGSGNYNKVVVGLLWYKAIMARRPRIYFPGALYHVVSRGNQRQRIFLDERDFRTYLSYLVEYKAKSILSGSR